MNSNIQIYYGFCRAIFFAFLLISNFGFSNIPKSCIDTIRDFNKRAKDSYIGLIAQIEIQKLFLEQKNSHLCAKKLFDIVLQERLKDLSPKIKNKISHLLKKRVVLNKAEVTYYNQESDTIYLHNDFPEVEPNYIYYASFIHEIEHALQNYLIQEKFPKVTSDQIDTVGLRTQQEIGAMLLEYDYIRNVPENEKKKALIEAEKNTTALISEADKKYFQTLLSGSYLKPIDYIKANQREGRYSVESIEKFFESFSH